jgi:hypothetical protein
VRYLTLAEALLIGEAVTGPSAAVVASASRLDLLDSALHPHKPGSATSSSTPTSPTKQPYSRSGSPRTIPSPEGNKRLAWQSLTLFCALNGFDLEVPTDEALT